MYACNGLHGALCNLGKENHEDVCMTCSESASGIHPLLCTFLFAGQLSWYTSLQLSGAATGWGLQSVLCINKAL